jgi:peptidoglycan/LPS O-acetylase OafA/YrhL
MQNLSSRRQVCVAPRKLNSLTALRFFAAIFVVCCHVGVGPISAVSVSAGELVKKGYVAVGLFYALSGFVLAYNYADRQIKYSSFVVARFARIYTG